MEEGSGVVNNSKNKLKQSHLIAILIILIVLIVGLIVGIVLKNGNFFGGQDDSQTKCEELEDDYEVRACLSHEEDGEELDDRYDDVLNKTFEEGDYESFNDLIMDRVSNLALENNCEKSLSWLDSIEKEYVPKLPIQDQYGFYVSGMEAALECDNSDKMAYYQGKMDVISASEEFEDYKVNNDYHEFLTDEIDDDGGDDE